MNVCRTCMPGTGCQAVERFPNATVAEWGTYHNEVFAIMAEIYIRGPVKASINALFIKNYTGGVLWERPEYHVEDHNHGIAIVGWGYDEERDKQYWYVLVVNLTLVSFYVSHWRFIRIAGFVATAG
jgi:cathepsin X